MGVCMYVCNIYLHICIIIYIHMDNYVYVYILIYIYIYIHLLYILHCNNINELDCKYLTKIMQCHTFVSFMSAYDSRLISSALVWHLVWASCIVYSSQVDNSRASYCLLFRCISIQWLWVDPHYVQ